jgi:hypothetical protein
MATTHVVQQGECLSSIAAGCGMPWKSLWDHPDNATLKSTRKDPNVLFPGDVVTIPDREQKEEARSTDARHRFAKKGSPTHIRIRLLADDQPRAGVSYELQVEGQTRRGKTNGGGFLEAEIPAAAETGVLTVSEGTARDVYQLGFGTLDPIDTDEGVRERLHGLGYFSGDAASEAIQAFQLKEGLPTTGRVDETTRARLQERYGQ